MESEHFSNIVLFDSEEISVLMEKWKVEIREDSSDRRFRQLFSRISREIKKEIYFNVPHDSMNLDEYNPTSNYAFLRNSLLLKYQDIRPESFGAFLKSIINTASLEEQCDIFSHLSYFEFTPSLIELADIAVRSNIKLIFESIAINNRFVFQHFDEKRWNNLVIKAFFIEADVKKIHRLKDRINPDLINDATLLLNEKTSAHRPVSEDLLNIIHYHLSK